MGQKVRDKCEQTQKN